MIKKLLNAFLLTALWLPGVNTVQAQALKSQVPLTDLSAFASPPKNWQVAGSVHADLDNANAWADHAKGAGILLNIADKRNPGRDLFFNLQHGDIDLEMDYMMAKGANSGIYLQGRYEIQLLDTWGAVNPRSSDNGGIYERWDESRPDGQKGYEGHAPRQNASRAPGLWQHMKISFQAPKFDAMGAKIANAKILYVWLNGVLIQEDVELSGPTRGAFDAKESALGPLRLQGDHGAIAFKNITYTSFDKPHPTVSQLKYTVYKGIFEAEPDYKVLKVQDRGTADILSSNEVKLANDFLIRYTGVIHIDEAGEYTFRLSVPGGKGSLRVNGNVAVPVIQNRGTGSIRLQPGNQPFDLFYAKTVDWAKPALALAVSGSGIREYVLSDANISSNDAVDPILIQAAENTILRSFTDVPGGLRVTHGAGVGSARQVHYTYDMDKGMIVQVWRGMFLDATPMWHERGDGSSRPAGSVQYLGKPEPAIRKLADAGTAWAADTNGTGFKPQGYVLDNDEPAFRYSVYGSVVNDASKVIADGQGIRREVTIEKPVPGLFFRLAQGGRIEELKKGWYVVDDKYYIRVDDAGDQKPVTRNAGSAQELIVPIQKKLSYAIIF